VSYLKKGLKVLKLISEVKDEVVLDADKELSEKVAKRIIAEKNSGLKQQSLHMELYREYDFNNRVYRIDNPQRLYYRDGGTTHRVITEDGVAHCVPAPGTGNCVLRWQKKEGFVTF
jgi:hypothetical protein